MLLFWFFMCVLVAGLRWPWLHACCCCALANGVIVVACQAWCDGFCCFVGAGLFQRQWFAFLMVENEDARDGR